VGLRVLRVLRGECFGDGGGSVSSVPLWFNFIFILFYGILYLPLYVSTRAVLPREIQNPRVHINIVNYPTRIRHPFFLLTTTI